MQNADAAGIDFIDPYIFPCRGISAADQVDSFIDNLGDTFYSYVWVDIEQNPSPGCSWSSYTADQNCKFIGELVDRILLRGKYPGFHSSNTMWNQVFGNAAACSVYSDYPLWYANYNGQQSYDDFVSFGGWTSPSRKQYQADVSVCGVTVNQNWYHQC
jgi:GH25 family lysozyme M1 (1,4-beta-N-acetylmuramidase)